MQTNKKNKLKLSLFAVLSILLLAPCKNFAAYLQSPYHYSGGHQIRTSMQNESSRFKFDVGYIHQHRQGLLDGTNTVTSQDVFAQGFLASLRLMEIETVMFTGVYKVSNYLKFSLFMPYYVKNANLEQATNGNRFWIHSQGIGDTAVKGTYDFFHDSTQHLLFTLGLELPTGSINNRGSTPAGIQILPYPMQLGSGTFNPIIAIRYQKDIRNWVIGFGGSGVVHLGTNYRDYALGNIWGLSASVTKKIRPWLHTMLELHGMSQGRIRGQDPDINPRLVPASVPEFIGGRRIDVIVAAKLIGQKGMFKHQILQVLFGAPIYQYLNGPVLRTRWYVGLHWSLEF